MNMKQFDKLPKAEDIFEGLSGNMDTWATGIGSKRQLRALLNTMARIGAMGESMKVSDEGVVDTLDKVCDELWSTIRVSVSAKGEGQ
jgi:hypothetical protein